MAKIFINYRRKDSAPYAGRLYDRLAGHFGPDHVFMDIDQIEPGEVFDQVIQEKLKAVQAAVVLIGEHWLEIADADGQRRLDHPNDWVRLEIAAVLERNIRVIPVLVGGAAMPKSTQLPESLAPLARRQAYEISDHRFHSDVDKLIQILEKVLSEKPTPVLPNSFSSGIEQSTETRLSFEPEMVRIPPGKFLMGSLETEGGRDVDEGPQHEVTIGYPFEIGKYAVTFDEYDAFAKATNRRLPDDQSWGRGKRPVINVSFNDAQDYVRWLSQQTGKRYRLPSEAEWEYAARAGTQTRYWWGDDIGENNANCGECGSQWDGLQTAPAGSFKANAFGLHDTAGNVWEWVQDCWHDNYNGAPADGSVWLKKDCGDCNRRVVRGGSWVNESQALRSTIRLGFKTDDMFNIFGFRISKDL
ncbi:SUMF1/EgtB/PvdO family nonheme iron enzyme [Nitrosomonas sp. Is24]|uniref:SUMF1/EgtB/PvdO family nonheme iron enzyme n=1 Tax=Nitrosomonas sp. Is24 TaxID=3080533 RepID=UPI00294ABF4F|nr:SUMF1/EgtB/PvdO family nonheme iron enzyme [Nitrosomonas sp. Is24]MDV6342212.1 SUMF1/EgtB/PvdO family nonheme iron enzyme [Nitrosomonas sp. Is24]